MTGKPFDSAVPTDMAGPLDAAIPADATVFRDLAIAPDLLSLDGDGVGPGADVNCGNNFVTWRYKDDPAHAPHLGFIIDDVGGGPSVAAGGEQVDLYGYTSMAVAAVQAQAREIEALRSEVRALRRELQRSRKAR